jgi:NTE family protein
MPNVRRSDSTGKVHRPVLPGVNEVAYRKLHRLLLSDKGTPVLKAFLQVRQAIARADFSGTVSPAAQETTVAVSVVLNVMAEFDAVESMRSPLGWLHAADDTNVDAFAFRGRAAQLLRIGTFILLSRHAGEGDVLTLLALAFGMDALNARFGDLLGGDPVIPLPPKLPGELGRFPDLQRVACVNEIGAALLEVGTTALARPQPLFGAEIDSVEPARGCPGDTVQIRGLGFGDTQAATVAVWFTGRWGTSVQAWVVSWSDTAITVIVPLGAGNGCVSIVDTPVGFSGLFGASMKLAGAIESCLGAAGARAAGGILRIGTSTTQFNQTCTSPKATFLGGPPIIDFFLANQRSGVTQIVPGGAVTLAWRVSGADSVRIAAVSGSALPAVGANLAANQGQVDTSPIQFVDGDHGTYVLSAVNRCGTTTARVDIVCLGKKALVLSGGGTKAAFEVGAVQCLYDVHGYVPDIVAGASAGALNAAKLAEGRGSLPALRSMWLGLSTEKDFYLEAPWFRFLDAKVKIYLQSSSSGIGFMIANKVASLAAEKIMGTFLGALGVPGWVYTVMTSIYPVTTGIIDVALLVDAARQGLSANAIFSPTPLSALVGANIDPTVIAQSGVQLRISMISLETGQDEIVDQRGVMLSNGTAMPLPTALLAATALPIAFPPVAFGPTSLPLEHFIDGGTRNNIPIRSAAQAGADRIVTIMASPRGMPFKPGWATATLLTLAPRALEILLDEVQEDDLAPYRGFNVPTELVSPSFLVHDTLTVDPGLISINMDYGYMCAYDDLVAPSLQRDALRRFSDDITRMRVDAWASEHYVNGEKLQPLRSVLVSNPDPVEFEYLRTLKQSIRDLTKARVDLAGMSSVPATCYVWWQEFERHPWLPTIPNPWSALTTPTGPVKAAAMPPRL